MSNARLKKLEATFQGGHKGPVSYEAYDKANSRQIQLYMEQKWGRTMPEYSEAQQLEDHETIETYLKHNPIVYPPGFEERSKELFGKYMDNES